MPSKASSHHRESLGHKMLISADDYQRMGAAGIFENKPPVELIAGEIFTMSPLSPEHNSHVDKITRFFHKAIPNDVLIRTQGSIRLDDYSEPEPDITLLRFDQHFYHQAQPTASDVHLIIEVAVHTLSIDRGIKKQQYASGNIPEYWIIIPKKGTVEIYKNPSKGSYLEKRIYQKSDEWVFDLFDLRVKGTDLLI